MSSGENRISSGRPDAVWRAELVDDLRATWMDGSARTAGSWLAIPGVLRRVARALAHEIPAEVERIHAVGPGAAAMGAAVALETGLPYVVVDECGVEIGRQRSGEDVVVVAVRDSDLPVGAPRAVCVARATHADVSALFVVDEQGRILDEKGA